MSRYQPDEPITTHYDDPDEAYENYRETEEYAKRDDPEFTHPYTIDHSKERYRTYSEAVLAASGRIAELRHSIAIYYWGVPYDLRRF
jgi:hypothetical protein